MIKLAGWTSRLSLTLGLALPWPLRQGRGVGLGCMALAIALSLAWGGPAGAQTAPLFWQCQAVDSTHTMPGYCPVGTTYPLPVAESGAAVGGGSIFRSAALTSTAVAVKATAGTVSFIHVANLGGSAVTCYLHLYNAAAADVTVGTTTPVWSMVLAAATIQTIPFSVPLAFGTAISAAATTTASGSTACSPIFTLEEVVYK